MKRVVILIIYTLAYLLSFAQDANHISDYNVDTKIYIVELKQQTEASEYNLISNNLSNLIDNEGNSYIVVKIGNQFWMAENLKSTKFNDGTKIPLVSDYKVWCSLFSPGYCWYFNDEGNYKTDYGALYNWYTVNTDKLCPLGWHVPRAEEWMILLDNVGKKEGGGKLKKIGNQYWMSPNKGATNATGFTALPGGSRGSLGSFFDEGLRGYWWSSTELDEANAWHSVMGYSSNEATGNSDHKKSGLSVRCVKD